MYTAYWDQNANLGPDGMHAPSRVFTSTRKIILLTASAILVYADSDLWGCESEVIGTSIKIISSTGLSSLWSIHLLRHKKESEFCQIVSHKKMIRWPHVVFLAPLSTWHDQPEDKWETLVSLVVGDFERAKNNYQKKKKRRRSNVHQLILGAAPTNW